MRQPGGLYSLSIERGDGGPVERVAPLAPGDVPHGDELCAAQEVLARARGGGQALAAVLRILAGSVPDPGAYAGGTAPRLPDDRQRRRPTAAHPRAYRGVHDRPPTPPTPGPVDLLAQLDGGRREAQVLAQLARYHGDALRLASCQEGSRIGAQDLLANGLPRGCRAEEVARSGAAMPPTFRRSFLWSVRGMPSPQVGELMAAYWGLQLETEHELRRLVAMMVCESPEPVTLRWVRALEHVCPERRRVVAACLLATRAHRVDLAEPAAILRRADIVCTGKFRPRGVALFEAICAGEDADGLFDGFDLADEFHPEAEIRTAGQPGSLGAVRRAMATIGRAEEQWARTGFAITLWRRCGELDGFVATLDELPWDQLDPEAAYGFADVLAGVYGGRRGRRVRQARWEVLRTRVQRLFAMYAALDPPYRKKARCHLSEIICLWWHPEDLAPALEQYLELLPRLCAPPFHTSERGWDVLSSLTRVGDADWRLVATAPDRSHLALERAARRENDEHLIAEGLYTLARWASGLTARTFRDAPARLLELAHTLGCLRPATRGHLIRELMGEDGLAANCDPSTHELVRLVELVDGHGDHTTAPLVSRRLRRFLAGDEEMSPAAVQRARSRLEHGWDRVRLAAIRRAVLERLAASARLGRLPDSEAERHAVLFQVSASRHRRALRRLLARRFAGELDPGANHPANRRWIESLTAAQAERWLGGTEVSRTLADGARLTLAFERDPLEVLRMGTYAGTCLGLGGGHAYSAVAAALDVNKQVVYCRDERGRVTGRQLVALSRSQELYCFTIYPTGLPTEIQELFLAFDRALASHLGVELHQPPADDDDPGPAVEDEIELLVARSCWLDDPITV